MKKMSELFRPDELMLIQMTVTQAVRSGALAPLLLAFVDYGPSC